MTDAQSRVTVTFIGADQNLGATTGAIDKQLASIATNAGTLKTRLGELTQASQTYTNALKSTNAESERIFQTNSKLTGQRVKEELKAQAVAAKELAAAQKAQQAEAERIFQTNARLTQQRVKDELKAQAQAERELAAAQKAQQAEAERIFQTNAKLTGQKVTEELQRQKQGYQALGLAAGALAAGLGAIATKGVQGFADFDKSIRTFGVVTESTGTGGLATLRGEVERLSAATTKTPQEIASVAVELGKAGFTAEKTKQALAGVVQSSEATGEGLARTGEVIGSTLNQFGLSADKSIKIADLLTQASNASAAGTNDLGEALSYVGSQAAGSNQSIDDTITTLALLANAGIKGSSAGTGLAEALRRVKLASASATTELNDLKSRGSKNAVAAFERLDQSVRDSQGNLKPFPEIIKNLKSSLGSLDQVNKELLLNALFGVQGGRVVQTLLGQTDEQIAQVTGSMAKFEGASAKASAELTKGLGASFTLLGSSTALGAQKIGEFLGTGLEPLVRGATAVINTFISLPAPIQAAIVTVGALTATLAAAVAVVTAFELANGRLAVTTAVATGKAFADTIATNANAAAKLLAAAATGQLTAAQNASISAFVRQAATAGLFAGAIAAIALAVDTFQAVGRAAEEQKQGVDAFTQSFDKLNEAQLKSADASTQKVAAASLEEASNKRIQDSIGGIQQGLDVLRNAINQFSLKGLLDQFAKLEAIPQPIRDLVAKLASALPSYTTAAEAAANNSKVAFGEVLDTADKLESKFKDIFNKGGLKNATKEELDALSASVAASISAIEKAAPADAADAKAKELRINRLKELQKQLAATGKVDAANGPKANTNVLEDKDKARKDAAKDQGEDLRESRQDAKAKEDAAFQDQQREAAQQAQDEERQKDQAYNDEKQRRATEFQDAQAAIDKRNEDEKQQRDASFQEAQAVIEKRNQEEKQQRDAAFQERQQQAEAAFKEGQRQRDEALKAAQTEAGRQLSVEGARGKDRRNLLRQKQTQDQVASLGDADLQGADGQPLSAEELAALAKRSAGVDRIRNKRDAEQAQFALQAITDRQNKLLKEQERQEDEAFKAKQKEEDRQFKAEQEAVDLQKEAEKRERDRQFRAEQEAIDLQKETEKQTAKRQFDAEQEARQQQYEAEKREAQRQFEATQREAERAFKEEQREKDRANAEAIKQIIESAKVEPPKVSPTPAPLPRFAGGDVYPGVTYLGGERGMERINFGQGRDALVGANGPQLFQVDRPGYVHPHHSPYTQAIVQTAHYRHQSLGRSPSVQVNSSPVIYRDDAMLHELRRLRSQVEAMRPINQHYDIATRNPMAEVYKATKMAARIR